LEGEEGIICWEIPQENYKVSAPTTVHHKGQMKKKEDRGSQGIKAGD